MPRFEVAQINAYVALMRMYGSMDAQSIATYDATVAAMSDAAGAESACHTRKVRGQSTPERLP